MSSGSRKSRLSGASGPVPGTASSTTSHLREADRRRRERKISVWKEIFYEFTGRSQTKLGVVELVDVGLEIDGNRNPPEDEIKKELGTVEWRIANFKKKYPGHLGKTVRGQAQLEAADVPGRVVLELISTKKGVIGKFQFDVVAPASAYQVLDVRAGIQHTHGVWGVGASTWYYTEPSDVSFEGVEFQEGITVVPEAIGGVFKLLNAYKYRGHTPARGFVEAYTPKTAGSGSPWDSPDLIRTGNIEKKELPHGWAKGWFEWRIPLMYRRPAGAVAGAGKERNFSRVFRISQRFEMSPNGDAFLEKGNVGGRSARVFVKLMAPTSQLNPQQAPPGY